MKKITLALLILLLASPVLAVDLVNVAGASRVALDGYDPVAFFTDGRPVNGSPSISSTDRGAIYFFATEEHKRLFMQDPAKYAPQYGGYCAFGVAINAHFPVDINTWQIRDNKLYLNLNPEILEQFNADLAGNIAKANRNWPGLVQKNG